eukprot:NODE_417_length_7834_cov_0.489334.p1 type:complete len:634 gc:universal NODE_417_length_7834_cov_0.489334:3294-1393(-)
MEDTLHDLMLYGLNEFLPMETLKANCAEHLNAQSCANEVVVGNFLIHQDFLLKDEKKSSVFLNFLRNLKKMKVDLSPEKIKLNLNWKNMFGMFKIAKETYDFVDAVYLPQIEIAFEEGFYMQEPLILQVDQDFDDLKLDMQPIAFEDKERNEMVLRCLNNNSEIFDTQPSQEITPQREYQSKKRNSELANLIFPSPKKTRMALSSMDIPSLNSDADLEQALCKSFKVGKLEDIIDNLNQTCLNTTFNLNENWKLVLPVIKSDCSNALRNLFTLRNFQTLKIASIESRLNWGIEIFQNRNLAIKNLKFKQIIANEEEECDESHKVEFLDDIFERLDLEEDESNFDLSKARRYEVYPNLKETPKKLRKVVKVGVKSLLNSLTLESHIDVVNLNATQSVELVEKTDEVFQNRSNFIQSHASIVLNPVLLKDVDLTKLIRLSCKSLTEFSGNSNLVGKMSSILIDEEVSIIVIRGILFSQLNKAKENVGVVSLLSQLRRNLTKFNRIHILILQYTMVGGICVPLEVDCNDFFIQLSFELPSGCIMQQIESSHELNKVLAALFDRQSSKMHYFEPLCIDDRVQFLMEFPSLNYILACQIISSFSSFEEFLKSEDPKFMTQRFRDARIFSKTNLRLNKY